MRIAVCIKQVPVLAAMKFDTETRTLQRGGVACEVSSFDVRALVRAVQLRDEVGGEVVALTMGPPQAREALLECLALGADRAVHLCDPAFAGADTLATAQALAAALRREQPDLIICGRYSVDAETAQVGPQIAALLKIAQVTQACSLEYDSERRSFDVTREIDAGFERVRASLPLLITATEDLAPERFASKRDREAAAGKACVEVRAAQLAADSALFGSKGSPTRVAELHELPSRRAQRILEGEDASAQLASILVREHHLFGSLQVPPVASLAHIEHPARHDGPRGIWVLAEMSRGKLRRVCFELLGKARELASALRTDVTAVLIGNAPDEATRELAEHGADAVLFSREPPTEPVTAEIHATLLAAAIRTREPRIVLVPSTAYGRDVAPRVAAELAIGLTGDCIDLGLNAAGQLLQYKPAFGGMIVAPILSRTFPEMATIRPGTFAVLAAQRRNAVVERLEYPSSLLPSVQVLGVEMREDVGADLDHADIVVGAGKGVGSRDDLQLVTDFADFLGAAVCTTRDVADTGWLPRHLQIGLTGRAIAPKLYIAIGIRGAFEHMVGVRRAGIVVAINRNAKAPVFKAADYGIVGDYREVLPALRRALVGLRGLASLESR